MTKPVWWDNFRVNNTISRAAYGYVVIDEAVNPERNQYQQELLAFEVLLLLSEFLRKKESVPDPLADFIINAIEYASQTSKDAYKSGNYINGGDLLLKKLCFIKEASGPRRTVQKAVRNMIIHHIEKLESGEKKHFKSKAEIARGYGVSYSTLKRIWAEYKENFP